MAQQTVLITGGNSGIGYECAKKIAEDPKWHVVILGRDKESGKASVEEIIRQTKNESVEFLPLNLGSLKEVRAFARNYNDIQRPPLHALVLNAGVQIFGKKVLTEDGFEAVFGVNHLGHFLFANLFIRFLAHPARIVFVSSDAHDPALKIKLPPPDYTTARLLAHPDDREIAMKRYTNSKLCNILCTYHFAKLLQKSGYTSESNKLITVNAWNPGLTTGTGLVREHGMIMNAVFKYVLPYIPLHWIIPNMNTPPDAGKQLADLITNPSLGEVTAKYFDHSNETKSSTDSYDEEKQLDLWKTSVELVNLTREDSPLVD